MKRDRGPDFTRFHTYSHADAGLQHHPGGRTQRGRKDGRKRLRVPVTE
jgi:hypothetical protein